ncbi:ubiquitin-like protein Pup [Brachybacterium sp. EF45031]|uniref:ubiquitin-like protein Pup n=1 Tax=Brachybacterium sillae TaxID=2810536 RepID=UPI00217EA330|nr:ubiquitin-like protein Pup [Brachybacterium sillae]MCS6710678.1 ubiquitin-like protein Pup [Brachybacterium sillae]
MTQQSLNGPGHGDDDTPGGEAIGGGQTFASVSASEDILDEIDAVLESNAETFVRSFVQKGGQ